MTERHVAPNASGSADTAVAGDAVAAVPEAGFRLPVILISFNRGPMMRKVVHGFSRQTVAVDVFIHDNGSDDAETRAVLDELEAEGCVVHRRPKIASPEELNLVDQTVQAVFADRPASPYAVSDCDVSIAESSPTTLQTYLDVLAEMPDVECAGPMLRIDDVPNTYALYNAMINRHIGRFWSREPEWATIAGRRVAFQRAPIDTTLAVYRAGEPFRRLRQGVRMYHPYDARHLDWYPDEHADAYRTAADGSTISNWSNPARERANRDVPIKHKQYRTVETAADGSLVAVTRTIGEPRHATPTAAQQTVDETAPAEPGSGRQLAERAAHQQPGRGPEKQPTPTPPADRSWRRPETLLALVEGVRDVLSASVPYAGFGRAWVWRQRAGVLEAAVSQDRLALDVVPTGDAGWQIFAVARSETMKERMRTAGLTAEPDGRRHALGRVSASADGGRDAAVATIAGQLRDLLERLR